MFRISAPTEPGTHPAHPPQAARTAGWRAFTCQTRSPSAWQQCATETAAGAVAETPCPRWHQQAAAPHSRCVCSGQLVAANLCTHADCLTWVLQRCQRQSLAQWRTGSHGGAEDTGRWLQLPRQQRICPHCSGGTDTIEHHDDCHHPLHALRRGHPGPRPAWLLSAACCSGHRFCCHLPHAVSGSQPPHRPHPQTPPGPMRHP